MLKMILIGFKDIKLAFRDRAGLVLMLLAPFLLTLGLGAVTGRFSGGSSQGISQIPVVLVNQDGGQLGSALVELFQSPDLGGLVDATLENDPAAAYRLVDDNQAAAAVVVPAGFTDSIIPSPDQTDAPSVVRIEVYANPTTPTSAGVVRTLVDEFVSQVEVRRVGTQVVVSQLVSHGLVKVGDVWQVSLQFSQAGLPSTSAAVQLNTITPSGKEVPFDVLALLAPGMALMFLMFTVSNGGRTLLTERAQGTLPRLLVTPTTGTQVLGGKVLGIFLTGLIQMTILIEGTSLMFNVEWGDPNGLAILVMAAVIGAVGWGMLITAIARSPGQVTAVGTAVMLTFGILGGTFINMNALPPWFRLITRISPNSWGSDGFTTLALGGGLNDILTPVLALLVMGLVLFAVSVFLFNRRGLTER